MTSISFPPLNKRAGNVQVSDYETSVIDFNGQLFMLTFERANQTDPHGAYIRVRDYRTGATLARNAWAGGLGCAIVIQDVIHVFGSSDWSNAGNSILHSVLDAAFVPSVPIPVLTTGQKLYNTDIAFDGTRYVMAVEYATSAGSSVSFYQSTDLVRWSALGPGFGDAGYAACPSISYDPIRAVWFITALAIDADGKYVTCPHKTVDFSSFTGFTGNTQYPNYICFLAPDTFSGEGSNTSDVSFIESGGALYGVYLVGDQVSWMNLRTFVYLRPLTDLIGEFWPA